MRSSHNSQKTHHYPFSPTLVRRVQQHTPLPPLLLHAPSYSGGQICLANGAILLRGILPRHFVATSATTREETVGTTSTTLQLNQAFLPFN